METLLHLLSRIQQLSLLAFLVSAMLAIGLKVTPGDVLAPLRDVRLVLVALFLNFAVAPAFAWLLTVLISLREGHAIGLLLLGGTAGAPFLPKLLANARCNIRPAVAMIILLNAGTILFLPFALPLLIPGLSARPWAIARPLLVLIVLPLVIGMAVRVYAAGLAEKCAAPAERISNGSLLLFSILLPLLNFRSLRGTLGSGAITAAIIYAAGLYALGWVLGKTKSASRAEIGFGVAARNFGAAMVPAAAFRDPDVMIMIMVNAIVSLVVLFFIACCVARRPV